MLKLMMFQLLFLLVVTTPAIAAKKSVYVDGVYDLAHYGHARSFQKARTFAAERFKIPADEIMLIVGVCDNDGNMKAYKRTPVYNLEQRVAQVMSFKGVDEVVANAPMAITNEFIDAHAIDLVMHGDDFDQGKIEKYYAAALQRGIFATFPYEPSISTTDILRRTTVLRLEEISERSDTSEQEREAISQVAQIVRSR